MTTRTPTNPDVRRILARLGRLRARIRAIFTAVGLGRWVVAAIGLLTLFFLADWLLDLPLAVRQFVRLGLLHPPATLQFATWLALLVFSGVLLVALTRRRHGAAPLFAFVFGGVGGLLVWLGIRQFFSMHVALPDDELVLSVESRFKDLKDRLAAALDFDRELADPSRGESEMMMRAVVDDAAEAARSLSFSKAVSGRRAVRWVGFALAALIGAGVLAAAFEESVGLWARRSLLLRDEAWPRDTHMFAVVLQADGSFADHPPEKAFDVAIGRSFTIYARAQGDAPDHAQVLDLIEGQEPLARRMMTVQGREDIFAYEFLDVRRPFHFILRGGDDDDDIPRYAVDVTIPPRVLTIESTVTFPEYLARPDQTVRDGTVSVPQGAKVRVTFTTDMDVAKTHALLGDKVLACEFLGAGPDGAARKFSFSYQAERSAHGRIVMETPEGKSNDPAADSFEVRVKTDRPPRIEWIYPRAGVQISPKGRVPLLVRADDDHGVAGLVLEVRVNAEEQVRRFELEPYTTAGGGDGDRQVPQAVTDGAFGRRRVLAYLPIEIGRLETADGKPLLDSNELTFRLEARDSRNQIRQSELARVDIRSGSALEHEQAGRRRTVRLALDAARLQQKSRREDIASLQDHSLGGAEMDLLKTVRFAQGRIAQDVDRAVQDLIAVFNGFVYARLGSAVPNDKILSLIDRYHRTTYGLEPAPDQEPPLRPAGEKGAWKGDPVFPYALYEEIVEAWISKEIYDKGLIDKMCAALADAVELGSHQGPAAHRAATEATSGEASALKELLVAQDECLATLKRLLDAMRGWQDLSELTMRLRGIIERQESLHNQLEGKDTEEEDKPDGKR